MGFIHIDGMPLKIVGQLMDGLLGSIRGFNIVVVFLVEDGGNGLGYQEMECVCVCMLMR